MDVEKLNELLRVSAYHDPDPEGVFRAVLEAVTNVYGDTMAMINLIDGERIEFRAVANPHRLMRRAKSMLLADSYCQFATGPKCPVVIQNAAEEGRHQDHPAVRFGLTRYLGVPIAAPDGHALGTLCFLDGRSDEPLDQSDVEFLSLLAVRVSAEVERERLIEARVREAHQAAEALRRAAEDKRRFTTSVIHDLRQPITTLRTLAHLLKTEADPVEQQDSLHLLDQCVESLHLMADELLEYAEIEAGNVVWRRQETDLGELVAGGVELFRASAVDCGVELRVRLLGGLGRAAVDRAKIIHVLRNLVDNALRHAATNRSSGSPKVCVEAAGEDASWSVSVTDSGPGITPSAREHIFDEFYQAPAAQEARRHGRGLGLAIVRHLCDAMGARIEVASEPGCGACFRVTFPREREEFRAEDTS